MLMKKLIRYCRGTVQFTVVGPYPERFLNLCSQGGVGLWASRRVENGITACCAQCHRPRLEYYAKKSSCALEIQRCSGMKNTARRYRRRTGLWIGAGLLVVGLLVMSRFVWRVEVQGTERLEPEVITAALAEYGVRSGALASGIDARTVERQMQIRFEEIAWITVNVEGSRVTAIIEETVPPPAVVEDGIPTNLIAAETGFITKVEVQNGNPVVKPGDSVQAGDLLVSGIMDNKVGESRTAHARGQVYAQVRAKLEIFTPYEQSDYVLREDCYLLMREVKKTVTPQEAMRQAEKALALREQDWAEAKIISREAVGTESPEGYTLAVEYLLEKQIAVEAPVQSEERQKAPIPEGKAR